MVARLDRRALGVLVAMGAVLAAMNSLFYLAVDRLLGGAVAAFSRPLLLLAGVAVGVSSSVIPYVIDQLAMARLPRASFALMLAVLPVFATVIGAVVLRQLPTPADLAGVALVVTGVAVHQASAPGKGN